MVAIKPRFALGHHKGIQCRKRQQRRSLQQIDNRKGPPEQPQLLKSQRFSLILLDSPFGIQNYFKECHLCHFGKSAVYKIYKLLIVVGCFGCVSMFLAGCLRFSKLHTRGIAE